MVVIMDITIRQGTTFPMSVAVKSGEDVYDLTGKTLVFSSDVQENFHKSTADLGSGFEILDAAQGEAYLELTPTETRGFEVGTQYRYEIELWDETKELVLLAANLTVVKGVNKDQ